MWYHLPPVLALSQAIPEEWQEKAQGLNNGWNMTADPHPTLTTANKADRQTSRRLIPKSPECPDKGTYIRSQLAHQGLLLEAQLSHFIQLFLVCSNDHLPRNTREYTVGLQAFQLLGSFLELSPISRPGAASAQSGQGFDQDGSPHLLLSHVLLQT